MRQLERVTGIEPVSQPWEGRILPLYYTRTVVAEATHSTQDENSIYLAHRYVQMI